MTPSCIGPVTCSEVNPKSEEDVDLAAWEGIVTSEEWIEGRVKAGTSNERAFYLSRRGLT